MYTQAKIVKLLNKILKRNGAMNKKSVLLLLFLFLIGSFLFSQDVTNDEGSSNEEPIIIKHRAAYNPAGRIDPFVNLIERKKLLNKKEEAKLKKIPSFEERQSKYPGIRGILVSELNLVGVVDTPRGKVAMFNCVKDNMSYFLKVGERVYNGVLKEAYLGSETGAASVVFDKILEYTDGHVKHLRVVIKQED